MGLGTSVWLAMFLAMAHVSTAATAAVRTASAALPTTIEAEIANPVEPVRRSGANCRRWRSLAARLGETYAGHQLRHVVATKLCAFSDDVTEDDVWGWPWRHHDVRADLPPQRHGQFGSWEIRCGQLGPRRRCALSLETTMAAGLDPEARPIHVVSHIVIDKVAGRESVLWRVHLAPDSGSVEAAGGIAVQYGDRETTERFDACGRRGCMAEAEPKLSAEVASWLWAGRSMTISLGRTETGTPQMGVLPAYGFQHGLTELIRLRRHETRAVAGR